MDKETFLLADKIKLIETSFIKDGWATIYESYNPDNNDQTLIYCCIVDSERIKSYKLDTDWVVQPSSEGKPAVYDDGTYKTHSKEGIEPFIFSKHFTFNNGHESYLDISEEFILYFKLYEKGADKQNRKFYFIDEVGDLDEVIVIEPNRIKIKVKYLKEYLSVRKVFLSICFDFMRLDKNNLSEMNIELIDKNFQSENYFYNHFIRHIDFIEVGRNQSWIRGKTIIDFDKNKTKGYHFDYENQQYEKFITGYDIDGNEILQDCAKGEDKHFILTYFKKDVLNKYYNEPTKYEVDGWRVSCKFFSLRIDNNIEDYVPVFLIELGMLPYKEQLHWKHYNFIPQQKGISNTYYKTMIEGSWVEYPEAPDLFFKHKYEQFNKKWKSKYGWEFYKPLAKEDKHIFTALHLPTSNNVKAFCEQILSITKITIDRLNEAELAKNIQAEKDDRGITKFEKFLKAKKIEIPDMIVFLRQLYKLRSGLLAHSFSNSNDDCKTAIKYFGIKDNNYIEVARAIFVKSIYTMNTLEKHFILNELVKE